jgi:hypothetical protein
VYQQAGAAGGSEPAGNGAGAASGAAPSGDDVIDAEFTESK